MSFTFIHTADWQLGKAFGQFPDGRAGELRTARQDVIEAIAEAARAHAAAHVLVAGDVWDSAIPSNPTLVQPLAIMGEHADITWWLLPGNHDPDGVEGLWDRVERSAPPNVRTLREAAPVEMAPGVHLLPAPWRRIRHGQDLTAWMDAAETPDGAIRIGLAHGSVTGFGSQGDTDSEVIPPDRAERARLDYLALGDWHARTSINARTHYPGTPEPDRHKGGLRGQVLAVTLERGREPKVVEVPTARWDWPVVSHDLAPDRVAPALDTIRAELTQGQPLRRTLARIEVAGEVTVAEWNAFQTFLEEMTGECAELVDSSELRLVVVPEDIAALDAQGSVRETAESLLARRDDDELTPDERRTAADALRLLLSYGATSEAMS